LKTCKKKDQEIKDKRDMTSLEGTNRNWKEIAIESRTASGKLGSHRKKESKRLKIPWISRNSAEKRQKGSGGIVNQEET